MLSYYISTFHRKWSTIPLILDEDGILECITAFTNTHISDLDACKELLLESVFIYEKLEEKKHMSVTDIRRFIEEVSLQPYSGKALYILRDFDDATPEAMNACLKVFEDPPEYTIILLWVKNPEKLLETIHSRTINLFRQKNAFMIPQDLHDHVVNYFQWDTDGLIRYLYTEKYDQSTAIAILRESLRYADNDLIISIETSLIHIYQVHENPRNILDRVFLCRNTENILTAV